MIAADSRRSDGYLVFVITRQLDASKVLKHLVNIANLSTSEMQIRMLCSCSRVLLARNSSLNEPFVLLGSLGFAARREHETVNRRSRNTMCFQPRYTIKQMLSDLLKRNTHAGCSIRSSPCLSIERMHMKKTCHLFHQGRVHNMNLWGSTLAWSGPRLSLLFACM